jgi:phosphatidylethanolamine-binding protein (PEBP) family uncharacterized protein
MQKTKTPSPRALLTGLVCLGVIPFAAGCGESTSTRAAATTTPATRRTANPPSTTVTSASHGASVRRSATAARRHRSARRKARVRQAFSSLANAKPAPKLSPAQRAHGAVDDIELTSPAIRSQSGAPATISRENTCYGADQIPALNWKNIPPGTAELAIFVISVAPVNHQLFYDWVVTGINPSLRGIASGQAPPGATTHPNSTGHATYTICPPGGKSETYLIALLALPTKLKITPGETPSELHKQALDTAHHSGLLVGSYQHT